MISCTCAIGGHEPGNRVHTTVLSLVAHPDDQFLYLKLRPPTSNVSSAAPLSTLPSLSAFMARADDLDCWTQMQIWALFWHIRTLSDQPIALGGIGLASHPPCDCFFVDRRGSCGFQPPAKGYVQHAERDGSGCPCAGIFNCCGNDRTVAHLCPDRNPGSRGVIRYHPRASHLSQTLCQRETCLMHSV